MKKIKIVGIIIFVLSMILVAISHSINEQNRVNSHILERIHKQKASTQEISKNIFYMYRNRDNQTAQVNRSIKSFISNMKKQDEILNNIKSIEIKKQSEKIKLLWRDFYMYVQKFTERSKIPTPYSHIILEKIIKELYFTNLTLIFEFDKLISMHQNNFDNIIQIYRSIQYILSFFISLFIIYFFTQIKIIIAFIQKFSKTSKEIIENTTVAKLQPIKLSNDNIDLRNATDNFNYLVQKIDKSIQYSHNSIEHTSRSLKNIEDNIEEFLIVLNSMDKNQKIDIEMTKKEDAVIQSLDKLMNLTATLKNLQFDLDNLIKKS